MMGICELGADCAAGCPSWIIRLAVVGGALIYGLLGYLIFLIVKSFKEDIDDEIGIVFVFFWPFIIIGTIIGGVVYYLARLLVMPIIGADKEDLRKLESEVKTDIKKGDEKVMDYLKYEYKPSKAKKETAKEKPGKKTEKVKKAKK